MDGMVDCAWDHVEVGDAVARYGWGMGLICYASASVVCASARVGVVLPCMPPTLCVCACMCVVAMKATVTLHLDPHNGVIHSVCAKRMIRASETVENHANGLHCTLLGHTGCCSALLFGYVWPCGQWVRMADGWTLVIWLL